MTENAHGYGLASALLALLLPACAPTAPPSKAVRSAPSSAAGQGADRPDPPAAAAKRETDAGRGAGDAVEDTWMACYVGEAKVGYMHTRAEPVTAEGQRRLRWTYHDFLAIRRWGDTTQVRTRLTSLETTDGRIVAFRSEIMTGPGSIVADGKYADGKLIIETTTGGRTQQQSIPWEARWGGFFADQQSLRKQPMKPGETRRLTALLPLVHRAGHIRMTAAGYEAVQLPTESRQLLRIDVATDLGATQLKTILWTDRAGVAWKTRDLQIGLEAVRTTRADVLDGAPLTALDLGRDIVIPVTRRLSDAHHTRRVVYRATLKDGPIQSLFATGATQSVRPIDQSTVEVTVRAMRPDQPDLPPAAGSDRPTPADTRPSPLIQSDDARVVAMASQVARGETDPWKVACALERQVKQKIRLKDYGTAMATAAEVAESLQGDCTEHAMLLAALCRARGIPARAAVGLVYYAPDCGFAYHMWTEVWIRDRWFPLDATLGAGGIGAAHLQLAHSSMQGTNAFAELLPVVNAIGRLRLEIVSAEYQTNGRT